MYTRTDEKCFTEIIICRFKRIQAISGMPIFINFNRNLIEFVGSIEVYDKVLYIDSLLVDCSKLQQY